MSQPSSTPHALANKGRLSLVEAGRAVKPGVLESWGRYPKPESQRVIPVEWASSPLPRTSGSMLPRGMGRSYGDSCLNDGGVLLTTAGLNRFIAFDKERGIISCEAGVTLEQVLNLVVPHGWFLPVTPGTKFVSVAGAVANDVHGKNHHVRGCFGNHVRRLELVRSDGDRVVCSIEDNPELFRATIGGMGLTGLITWVEFALIPVKNPFIAADSFKMKGLDAFFEHTAESEKIEYTVSWVDSLAKGHSLGKGLFMRGDHAGDDVKKRDPGPPRPLATIPFDFPEWVLNRLSMKAFNILYYQKQLPAHARGVQHYNPFFYPLDVLNHWNRIYGKRGFIQYQCVLPFDGDKAPTAAVLDRVARSGTGSFLTVVKMFGTIKSPGMMSFPRPGITLTFDFPMDGELTLKLCDDLDAIVREAKGALYPAKDARMSPEMFRLSFPKWEEFARFVDPAFSSSFWRRVAPQ